MYLTPTLLPTSTTQNRKYEVYREPHSISEEYGLSFSYRTLRAIDWPSSLKPAVKYADWFFFRLLEALLACYKVASYLLWMLDWFVYGFCVRN